MEENVCFEIVPGGDAIRIRTLLEEFPPLSTPFRSRQNTHTDLNLSIWNNG